MKKFMITIAIFLLGAMAVEAGTALPGADDWYRNHYAPVWKENSKETLAKAAIYYDKTVFIHPPVGDVEAVDSRQWLADSLREWSSGGWVGSDIAEYRFDQLNPSTAAFKVKWRSWYTEAAEDFECSWYLADARGDTWVFTQFAVIDCDKHDL